MANYNARSGLQPKRNGKLPYDITTSEAKEYLQRKFDVVTRMMQKGGDDIGRVSIDMLTTDAGSRFRPFILVLPLNVLQKFERKNPEEPDIFNPEDDDEFAKKANLKPEIRTLINAFQYDKHDADGFLSKDWRRARGVSSETARRLRLYVTPKILPIGEKEQRVRMVQVLIDPIRLFYDMLVFDNDRSDFKVEINSYKRIRSGEYRYSVNRVKTKGKNKNYSNQLADELNRAINGNR